MSIIRFGITEEIELLYRGYWTKLPIFMELGLACEIGVWQGWGEEV